MDAVSQLRSCLLPILQNWKQELDRDYPGLTTTIGDTRVGGHTEFQGHIVGIEFMLESVSPELPDNVALLVTFNASQGKLSIHSADVVWGDGHVEADLFSTPANFDSGHMVQFIEQLSALLAPLKQAIRRGRPSPNPRSS